jgi:HSP20 family protein
MPDKDQQRKSQNQNTASNQPDKSSSSTGLQSGRRDTSRSQLARPYSSPWTSDFFASPFDLMRRFNEDVERWFGGSAGLGGSRGANQAWSPNVEMEHRGNELLIRADLPGMDKEDIDVEVSDEAVTIRGERRQEHEDEHDGFYRSERSYGSFYRTVPLPEGSIADSAKANFKNGVLEIRVQAPPSSVSRGRKLEIGGQTQSDRQNQQPHHSGNQH